jgi:predicted aspartyl protease
MPGGTGTSPGMTTPGTTKAAPTTASSAKAAIEAKGYTAVKSLSRDAAGNWSAKAVKNNQEVAVLLDASGNIKEQ